MQYSDKQPQKRNADLRNHGLQMGYYSLLGQNIDYILRLSKLKISKQWRITKNFEIK